MSESWTVKAGSETTSAIYDKGAGDTVLNLAHGAGGNMNDGSMTKTAKCLNARGLSVVRFNFMYKEKKSGRPDPMPKLEACFTAVVDHTRAAIDPKKVVIGGKSMGGRAASMLASQGFDCDALLLYAYPLHPPGHPEKLRDAHLKAIEVPVLCFSGQRDPFMTPSLMENAIAGQKNWTMRWVEGADHSFHVLKSSGRNDQQVMDEMSDISAEWIAKLTG